MDIERQVSLELRADVTEIASKMKGMINLLATRFQGQQQDVLNREPGGPNT